MFESTGWILDETELTDTLKYDLLAPTVVKSSTEDDEVSIGDFPELFYGYQTAQNVYFIFPDRR